MITNKAARDLIKKWESVRLQAYVDEAGVWTIGWGHTAGVRPADICTLDEANAMFVADLSVNPDFVALCFLFFPSFDSPLAARLLKSAVKRSSNQEKKMETKNLKYAIIGATGNVGKKVAQSLIGKGQNGGLEFVLAYNRSCDDFKLP